MRDRPKLLVVDDDVRLLDALALYLGRRGYEVISAGDGCKAWQRFLHDAPDLILLDIMLPGMDGWELCERLRKTSDVPVIMLTARGQEYDRVKGLKLGADDYVVKPFSLHELEARIEAVLRRAQRPAAAKKDAYFSDGVLTVDSLRWQTLRYERLVDLTATEQRLLFLLVEHADRTLPAERILDAVWGPAFRNQTNYVKLYIWRLRQKIESNPNQPTYIITERGVGYRFVRRRPTP